MFGAAPENGPGTCPRDLGQAALHGLLETPADPGSVQVGRLMRIEVQDDRVPRSRQLDAAGAKLVCQYSCVR